MDGQRSQTGLFRLPRRAMAGCALAGVTLISVPLEAAGQTRPGVRLGAGLSGDLLVGDVSDFIDGGSGRFLMADFRIDDRDRVQLRLDGGWSGLVDDEDEPSGARAENDVVTLLVGPQLTGRLGRFRPYAAGLAGLLAVRWHTEQEGVSALDDSDTESGLAWGAHAGLGLVLDEGDHPVVIQVEGRLLQAGEYAFARAPDPASTAPVGLIRNDIGVLSLRVAVTLGF